ncbi:hypothetical protein QUB52_17285 [Microcoleus sp. A6-C6]|uniref:hypothetical protein n=2 Tax=Microcoleus TaxID=44471 RepID=UPI002FCF8600
MISASQPTAARLNAMTQFVLDRFEAFSSSFKSEIEEARQKFEAEFVTSEFYTLNLKVYIKIDEINRLVDEGFNSKDPFLISKKFQEAHELLLDIANNYQKVDSDEKVNNIIKDFSNELKALQMSFEAFNLMILGGNKTTKDPIDRYVHYIRAYQLFREVATNYWDHIPLEARKFIADIAYFLVKSLLIPHRKILKSEASSLLSVFEQDQDLQILKKKQLENLSISVEESSKLNSLEEISNYLPGVEGVVNKAVEQTRKWMELGIDISDPCVVTPLEEMADNYPEIAEYCNDLLIEMVKEQMNQIKNSSPDINKEMLDEF